MDNFCRVDKKLIFDLANDYLYVNTNPNVNEHPYALIIPIEKRFGTVFNQLNVTVTTYSSPTLNGPEYSNLFDIPEPEYKYHGYVEVLRSLKRIYGRCYYEGRSIERIITKLDFEGEAYFGITVPDLGSCGIIYPDNLANYWKLVRRDSLEGEKFVQLVDAYFESQE